jgi:hypothetical protein
VRISQTASCADLAGEDCALADARAEASVCETVVRPSPKGVVSGQRIGFRPNPAGGDNEEPEEGKGTMRKYLYLAGAAATAAVMVMTAAPALAAVDVLTINKVGGANVHVGDILKASLVTNTSANFFKSSTGTTGIKCAKSSFTAKVTANPGKPGTAKESVTSQTFGSCTSNVTGVTSVQSVKVGNLPYNSTISDSTGFPVTVKETSSTKPLKTTLVLNTLLGTVTCVYTASSIKGKASNTGNTVGFTNQKFTLSSGPTSCFGSGFFTAKYGPVRDTSRTNSPKVFVN